MYKPHYFVVQEYVPPYIFKRYGQTAWEFLDDRLLRMDDALRDKFGPMTINNWHTGGDREWSGLRTPSSPYYSETSQHSYGRASDKIFHATNAEAVRQYILAHPDEFPLLMSLELATSWLHSDTRNCERIKTYKPTT